MYNKHTTGRYSHVSAITLGSEERGVYSKGNHGGEQRYAETTEIDEEGSITDEFGDTPVLETAIRKITADDKWNFALRKLLDGDLKCICFTVEGNKNGGIHAV
jgi:hypothetical protein